MNAIILSAGLGTRLKPISSFIPKPLLPIVDCPIIEINIKHLQKIGVKKIGINLFHKANLIKKILNNFSIPLDVVVEKKLSGTGGALLNFKKLLRDDVIIHNCDVISSINLDKAIKFHKLHTPVVTLLLTKNFGTNCVKVDNESRIEAFTKENSENNYTYTGIAIVSESICPYFPKRDIFSIIDVYQKLINDNKLVLGFPTKEYWFDIGSHSTYWKIHDELLNQKIKFDEVNVDSPISIHHTSMVQTKNLEGFISIGPNCFISKNVRLKNTIVFENSKIEKGYFEKCLLSDKFCIRIQ